MLMSDRTTFMRRLTDRYHQKVRLLHLCNYVMFFVFTFLFLYRVEADLITLLLQHCFPAALAISSFGIALVITLILLGVKVALNGVLHLKGRYHAFSFVPSFALLALLTNIVPWSPWIVPLTLIVLSIFFFVVLKHRRGYRAFDNFWTMAVPNLLVMLGCLTYVTVVSNTDDVMLHELKIERCLSRAHYDAALNVGHESLSTSRRLTALRAYALSKEQQLGEHIFEYPLLPGSSDLFLYPSDAPSMILPVDSALSLYGFTPVKGRAALQLQQKAQSGQLGSHKALADYWLCYLLMKKKLDDFARWLPRFYSVNAQNGNVLPKHYREALILYCKLFIHPRVIYKAAPEEETNYNDFMELCDSYSQPQERSNFARRLYGDTYWWYFYFQK
jgi:hypothetical protein